MITLGMKGFHVSPCETILKVWVLQGRQKKGHQCYQLIHHQCGPVTDFSDGSADTVISGRYGSEQLGPIILPCCDSKCHPQCSALLRDGGVTALLDWHSVK